MTVQATVVPEDGTPALITAPSGEFIVSYYYEVNDAEEAQSISGWVRATHTRDESNRSTAVTLVAEYPGTVTFEAFVLSL